MVPGPSKSLPQPSARSTSTWPVLSARRRRLLVARWGGRCVRPAHGDVPALRDRGDYPSSAGPAPPERFLPGLRLHGRYVRHTGRMAHPAARGPVLVPAVRGRCPLIATRLPGWVRRVVCCWVRGGRCRRALSCRRSGPGCRPCSGGCREPDLRGGTGRGSAVAQHRLTVLVLLPAGAAVDRVPVQRQRRAATACPWDGARAVGLPDGPVRAQAGAAIWGVVAAAASCARLPTRPPSWPPARQHLVLLFHRSRTWTSLVRWPDAAALTLIAAVDWSGADHLHHRRRKGTAVPAGHGPPAPVTAVDRGHWASTRTPEPCPHRAVQRPEPGGAPAAASGAADRHRPPIPRRRRSTVRPAATNQPLPGRSRPPVARAQVITPCGPATVPPRGSPRSGVGESSWCRHHRWVQIN